jgi:TRAP-type C4-dicarboxylate transport system substrate-binding protein
MRIGRMILLFMFMVLILPGPVYSLTIKIGSSARPRSPWGQSLEELGKEWKKISGGKIKIEICTEELVGGENDMIREMQKGTLGGVAIFGSGIPQIHPGTYVYSIPLLLTSKKEHDFVFDRMKPLFEREIEKQGFKLITWSLSGWVRLFSKHPVFYPEDLKKHKLSLSTWDPAIDQAWRTIGFQIVQTDLKDLMMALQSGMVDAFFLSPLEAKDGRYFTLAPNMCDIKADKEYWCIVLTKKTWEAIPDQYKDQMEKTAQKLSEDLYEKVIKLENEALGQMEEEDLIINKVPADALEKWQSAIRNGLDKLIEKNSLLREVFDRMMQYLKEYREKNPHRPR